MGKNIKVTKLHEQGPKTPARTLNKLLNFGQLIGLVVL